MPARIRLIGWGLLLAVVACADRGCIRSKSKSRPDGDGRGPVPVGVRVEVPDAAPQELAAVMDGALEQAQKLARTPGKGERKKLPAEEFQRQIFTGIKAAEMIAAHADADKETQATARRTNLSLLYLGARHDGPMFEQRLVDFAEQIAADHPESKEAALAAACALELRHLDRNKPKGEVMARLVEYGESYPTSVAGIELFRLYGKQLESNQDRAGAMACYEKGLTLYRETPGVNRLSDPLRKLQREKGREVATRQHQEDAYQAKVGRAKQRLGGGQDGYFVIYAEENVKPPRHGGFYFYCYEYEVLRGINEAATYVLGLPEKYSWKLIQRFPQTPGGREKAYGLWKKLLKEKRYGKGKKK